MKVFLSWSGSTSNQLARIFKEWLPNVLQYVEPYFSEEDIELGEFFPNNIKEKLTDYNFGLIFITEENIRSPWINFEAGALSKDLDSRLVPLLWGTEIDALNPSPLKLYQSPRNFDKDSIKRLIIAINEASEEHNKLKIEIVRNSFDKWWPDLKKKIDGIPKNKLIKNTQEPQDSEPVTKEQMAMYMRGIERTIKRSQNRSFIDISNSNKEYYKNILSHSKYILDDSINMLRIIQIENEDINTLENNSLINRSNENLILQSNSIISNLEKLKNELEVIWRDL